MTATEQPLYYAEGRNIHKRPIEKKVEGGTRITIGFRAAVATDEVGEEGAQAIAGLMNQGVKFDALLDVMRRIAAADPTHGQFAALVISEARAAIEAAAA